MSGWHWEHCPHCKGEGWRDVITGGYVGTMGSGAFTSRERCDCCDGCGRVKVPNGYHLDPDVVPMTVTTNITALSLLEGEIA